LDAAEEAMRQAGSPEEMMRQQLRPAEWAKLEEEPWRARMLFGTAYHRATAAELLRRHGKRFIYNPSLGPDFYDTKTKRYVEFTAEKSVPAHLSRAVPYPSAGYVAYSVNITVGLR
jgi:hypothetical protein